MYRTLKRPMFRIGGPVNQGTGIMSHVEPKHYVMGGRVGFARGLTPAWYASTPNDSGSDILSRNYGANEVTPVRNYSDIASERRAASDAKIAEYNRQRALELYGDKGIPSVDRPKIQKGWFGETSLEKSMREKKETNPNYTPFSYTAAERAQLGQSLNAARDQEKLYDSGVNVMEGADRPAAVPVAKNQPQYDDTTKTDPREQIKKDASLLKELMYGEDYQDMTKGEVALVVARALAEPGSIGNKIRVANELAFPIIKAKKAQDKESVLEAYKAYREEKKAEIMAGKEGTLEKNARAMTAAHMKANPDEKRSYAQVYDDTLKELSTGEGKLSEKVRASAFSSGIEQLRSKVQTVTDTEADIAAGKKLSKSELATHEKNKRFVDNVRQNYPDLFAINFRNYKYATGGRVKLADGTSDPEDQDTTNTTPDKTIESTTTPADAATQQTQLKPVIKLSFNDLRARLPKEITNDIVGLLASSEQALQDFAYIKTQQDVNNFNVKYGVNLVLPSNR